MVRFLNFLKEKVPLRRGYALVGRESFFRKRALEHIVEAWRDHFGTSLEVVFWQEGELGDLLSELQTPDLFGAPKLVVFQSEKIKGSVGALEGFFKSPLEKEGIVFSLEKLDQRTKLGKLLKKHTLWVECEKLYHKPPPWRPHLPLHKTELCQWVVWEITKRGRKIAPEDAYIFIHRLGNDPAAIHSAIEAFLTYSQGENIQGKDLVTFLGLSRRSSGFEFVDALISGNFPLAWEALEDILREGVEDAKGQRVQEENTVTVILLSLLYRKVHTLWRAHLLLKEGENLIQAANQLGIPKFLFANFKKEVENTNLEELEDVLKLLFERERRLKTGRQSGKALLQDIVFHLRVKKGEAYVGDQV